VPDTPVLNLYNTEVSDDCRLLLVCYFSID
jgi:hypothetical protein